MSRWLAALGRLAVVLAAVTLATSRIGLVLHELGGHGGLVVALGGRITEVTLFRFAGGWIRYELPDVTGASLMVSLGGIAIESLVGALVYWRCRGDGLGIRIARTLGATLVVHAMVYLAGGTWHGYGDGHVLHDVLEDGRYPVAVIAGALACTAAYLGARNLFAMLVATLPSRPVTGALVALGLAGAVNAALVVSDLRGHRGDATYATIMTPEPQRIVARELEAWEAANPTVDRAAIAAREAQLQRDHADFPFKWMLAIALVTAAVAGSSRSRTTARPRITGRLVAVAVALAVGSTVLVAAIGTVSY